MGLPLEQWRGGGEQADGDSKKQQAVDAAPAGCRTPDNGKAARDCPAAPRKRRAPEGVVSRQQRRDFYNGDDVEAFFAANNL